MSWIVLLKTGKRLPRSLSQRLATISTADECAETILGFINDHAPGARELVFPSLFFFFAKLLLLFESILNLVPFLLPLFMDLLSMVKEVMEGAAPVDQSLQERPKGPSTDSTSTLPYSYYVSNPSSPSSSPVVSTPNYPSGVPSITIPPLKVEYLPDPIPVPSPLFQGRKDSPWRVYLEENYRPCMPVVLHHPTIIEDLCV